MRMKLGAVVAFAATSLWAGNVMFAQSGSAGTGSSGTMGSGSSSRSGSTQGSGSSSRSQGSSDQYGSSTSSQGTTSGQGNGNSSSSGSSTQRGGSSNGSYGNSSGMGGASQGTTGSSSQSGMSGSTGSTGSSSTGGSQSGSTMGSTNSSQDMNNTSGYKRSHDASVQLQQNPALASKLSAMLPAGMSAQDAATGFKNVREFAEAVHVAHDMNIPFDQIKTKVSSGVSLDQAVKDLKPGVDKSELKRAKDEAKDDLKNSKQ
jgi:hypothetical protein